MLSLMFALFSLLSSFVRGGHEPQNTGTRSFGIFRSLADDPDLDQETRDYVREREAARAAATKVVVEEKVELSAPLAPKPIDERFEGRVTAKGLRDKIYTKEEIRQMLTDLETTPDEMLDYKYNVLFGALRSVFFFFFFLFYFPLFFFAGGRHVLSRYGLITSLMCMSFLLFLLSGATPFISMCII